MEISFLGSKKILHIVEYLLNSQPPCGIIRTTADEFLLPYSMACTCPSLQRCDLEMLQKSELVLDSTTV
jgi:hypothetical protein